MRNMTVDITFKRDGKTLYKGSTFAGFTTIFNGVKRERFAMSLNQRLTENVDDAIRNILMWAMGLRHASPVLTLTRRLFEDDRISNDYESAKEYLETEPLVSPIYLILGAGAPSDKDGCLITRAVDKSVAPLMLDRGTTWLLETNYDHWEAPPADDDRRTPGNHCMKVGIFELFLSKDGINSMCPKSVSSSSSLLLSF